MSESMQERCEREAGKVRSVSLLAFNVDISTLRNRVASDEAVHQLKDDLLAKVDAWIKALPKKEPHD